MMSGRKTRYLERCNQHTHQRPSIAQADKEKLAAKEAESAGQPEGTPKGFPPADFKGLMGLLASQAIMESPLSTSHERLPTCSVALHSSSLSPLVQ